MQWEKLNPCEICEKFNSVNGDLQMMRSFMAMLSKSGVCCAIEDSAGRVIYLNAAAAKAWNAGDCPTKTIPELLDIVTGYDCAKQNRTILKTLRPFIFYAMTVNKKGKSAGFTILKFPVWDADDDVLIASVTVPATRAT